MEIAISVAIVAAVSVYLYISGERESKKEENEPIVDDVTITELGPVTYYANDRNNQADNWFEFYYKKDNGQWLTYIRRMPDLNGRSGNLHVTHRYCNTSGEYWICYDPQPKTLKEAQIISRAWADRELEYIATGRHFEEQEW